MLFKKYYELLVSTQDVRQRLEERRKQTNIIQDLDKKTNEPRNPSFLSTLFTSAPRDNQPQEKTNSKISDFRKLNFMCPTSL